MHPDVLKVFEMSANESKQTIKRCKNKDEKMRFLGAYFAAHYDSYNSLKNIMKGHAFCPSCFELHKPNISSYVADLICDKMFKGATHFVYKRFKDEPHKIVVTLLYGEAFGACTEFGKKRMDLIFNDETLDWSQTKYVDQ